MGFVCNEYPPDAHGGIGSFTYDLAHALAERGHRIWVVGLSDRDAEETDGPIRVVRIRRSVKRQRAYVEAFWDRWRLSRILRRIARQHRLDLVEAPEVDGATAFFHWPVRASCPLVVRYHGSTTAYAHIKGGTVSRLTRFFEGMNLKIADYRIAVSKHIEGHTRACFGEVGRAKKVIPNFVDTDVFAPLPGMGRDPHMFLFVGRVSLNKGAPQLFAALPEIFRRCQAARLVIVGPDSTQGPHRTSLLRHLMDSTAPEWRNRITFKGRIPRSELPRWYARAICCVFPSVAEALGIVAIESMACGCPIIVSKGCGLEEVLGEDECGFLCDPQDKQDLAGKVLSLLHDPALAARLGWNARRRAVLEFSIDKAVGTNESFYEECLKAWAASRRHGG